MEYLKKPAVRPEEETEKKVADVAAIIAGVRKNGDEAVRACNTKFDGNTRELFRVSREEIDAARAKMTPEEISDLEAAAKNIREFAKAQLDCVKPLDGVSVIPGARLGHRVIPLASCGCYVPGGSYPLFSTALMLVVPAKVAGVRRVVAVSPTVKGTTEIDYRTLAAMDIAGADEIYAIGGVQAIAALAYGTDQVKAVDKIVGPGNQYVAEAKRQCFGQVGIDFVAGPSEVLAIADESADPEILAADMLAQSEHDRLAKGILVTTSRKLGEDVMAAVERQLKALSTADIAADSWHTYGEVILAESLEEACTISDEIAPEHLEICVREEDLEPAEAMLTNFGSLFIGQETGEVFGDYASGTNHSLPTMRASRYTGGVWVGTFLKVCSFQRYNREAMMAVAPLVSRMANGEGLMAHKNAADIRMKR
ncbi:histidinol dehydrogenase [[Clostridium] aminophilum]|uniref:Histidinol dehydrogenase n=1 Tax=[Clostridium] aminophilum TaxID=1526 RepID=A0A1I6JG79_9FIRM|nr:histidinol dehydrogenase [[Clostridium] aminophilum]SFR77600.1 histidinol dehydrogenase [[Clostridium] aminophilum]